MQLVLRLLSYLGIGLSLIPAVMVYLGKLDYAVYAKLMVVGMFLWFASAVFWIKPDRPGS